MTNEHEGKRYIGYVRVSQMGKRDADDEAFQSERRQREAIERWATYREVELIDLPSDLDQSGGKRLGDREHGAEALAMIERGDADGIVCAYLSRFSRSVGGALLDIAQLTDMGADIAICDQNIDTAGSQGKLQLHIMLAFAQFERDQRSEGWVDSKRDAVARGIWVGHAVPFGYDKVDGRLKPNSDAATVRQTAELAAAQGLSAATRAWHEPCTPSQLQRRLTALAYIGRQKAHGDVYPGHKPILTQLQHNVIKGLKVGPSYEGAEYLLSGLVRCSVCDAKLVGTRGGLDGHKRLMCSKGMRRGGHSPSPSCNHDELAELLGGIISATYRPGDFIDVLPDLEAPQQAVDAATAELAAFVANVPAATPGFADALAAKQSSLDAAQAALRAAPAEHVEITGELTRSQVAATFAELTLSPSERVAGIGWLPLKDRLSYRLRDGLVEESPAEMAQFDRDLDKALDSQN